MDKDGFKKVVNRKKRPPPVIGRGKAEQIAVVSKPKVHSVFISRIDPKVQKGVIEEHVKNSFCKLASEWKVESVPARFDSYVSFKVVFIGANDFTELLNPDLWPEGALVKRFFYKRNYGVRNDNGVR